MSSCRHGGRDVLERPVIENCPDVCERAYWYADPVFEGKGQHNCPHRYGVTYAAAIIDGRVNCKLFKRKGGAHEDERA